MGGSKNFSQMRMTQFKNKKILIILCITTLKNDGDQKLTMKMIRLILNCNWKNNEYTYTRGFPKGVKNNTF